MERPIRSVELRRIGYVALNPRVCVATCHGGRFGLQGYGRYCHLYHDARHLLGNPDAICAGTYRAACFPGRFTHHSPVDPVASQLCGYKVLHCESSIPRCRWKVTQVRRTSATARTIMRVHCAISRRCSLPEAGLEPAREINPTGF